MITRHFMRTRQLKPGMKLDQTILDRTGRNLVMRGSILDDYVIDSLLRMGIMNVYIQEGEPEPDNIEQMITPEAKKQIERLHKDDPAKVKLSDSVKNRVAEGIQYIYANTESEKLSDTADSIASNLMDAINANNAIAIDISTLKTSDEYTFKHSVDVATMAMIIGKQQCLPDKQIYELGVSGLLHDIGKTKVPASILNKPARLTDEEFKIMKTHSELGAAIIKDMDFPQDHPLVHTVWEICRWHHERWDGKGYPDGLKGEEIPISAQVVSIVDVYDALTSERCYKKAFDHNTAIKMILDGQCGQFNPILLKCFKELSPSFSKLISKENDDNKYYNEAQRLSNEILSDKSLPNQIYSQSLIKVMQEKIDFFKSNSGLYSIDYNAVSGQLTILNEKQHILCQVNNPNFNLFKEFGINREDAKRIQIFLHQTSVYNKEISVQIKAKVENGSQMYKLKLHTLWSHLKKDGYIGIIGYFDTVK